MARALTVGSILRLTMVTQYQTQVGLTRHHFSVTAITGTPPTDQQACTQLDTLMQAPFRAMISNQALYRGALAQVIQPLPLQVAVDQTSSSGAGTGGANAGPWQVSGVISWRTQLAKQAGRGRTFTPFISTSALTATGTPTAGFVNALNTYASTILGPITIINGLAGSATLQLGLYHRALGTATTVVTGSADSSFGTTRRRGQFGRPNTPPI